MLREKHKINQLIETIIHSVIFVVLLTVFVKITDVYESYYLTNLSINQLNTEENNYLLYQIMNTIFSYKYAWYVLLAIVCLKDEIVWCLSKIIGKEK